MTQTQTIPVVDLRDLLSDGPQRASAVSQLSQALAEVGFFALVGHDIDQDLIDRLYAKARETYDLPLEVKQRYERPETMGQRGYTSFGREHAKDQEAADLKEYWSVGPEETRNVYPENLWPVEVPELRTTALEVYRRLGRCARAILTACAETLGLAPDRFVELTEGGETLLRILHYPPIADDRDPSSVRAAAHEDVNLITLLCGATAAGLELLSREGEWLPIHALPGQIIVDSGDMLQQLSNGYYRSTTHRVVNPDDDRSRRFSMPCFVHPRPEVDLTPLPECVAKTGGIAQFGSTTASKYLTERLQSLGLGARS